MELIGMAGYRGAARKSHCPRCKKEIMFAGPENTVPPYCMKCEDELEADEEHKEEVEPKIPNEKERRAILKILDAAEELI